MVKPRIVIGIDPGVHTGLAVFDVVEDKLIMVFSCPIHIAMRFVEDYFAKHGQDLLVRAEDARLRKWFGAGDTSAKLQGAGSVKRDAKIWDDFLKDTQVRYEMVHPLKGNTKLTDGYFRSVTGWQGRTNEHGRDAAMLIYGYKKGAIPPAVKHEDKPIKNTAATRYRAGRKA